jgi:hemolysin III
MLAAFGRRDVALTTCQGNPWSATVVDMNDVARSAKESVLDLVAEVVAEVKPRLRGWLHLAAAPLTLAAGIVLIVLSPTAVTRVGSALFTGTAVVMFSVSAIYHCGTWSPRTWAFLRRFDHSNIFLLIAGSYTPFTLILLEGRDRVLLLSVIWSGALLGVLFRIFWTGAPRWLYVPIYIALGWAAVFFLPSFAHGADRLGVGVGTTVLVLVIAGGALYTLGGVVYGLKKPNPFPRWFGFHEVFHTLVVAAFAVHYVGVSVATYSLR